MATKCKILFSIGITIILLNGGYFIMKLYSSNDFSLMHFSTGMAVGILFAVGIKEILKRTGPLNK